MWASTPTPECAGACDFADSAPPSHLPFAKGSLGIYKFAAAPQADSGVRPYSSASLLSFSRSAAAFASGDAHDSSS